jgi:hypothetical protein
LSQFQNVQIKQQMQTDVFLPKINLLLSNVYRGALTNCQLSSANYSWTVGQSALVSTIHYDINYECTNSTLEFGVDMTNNQLKIVKVPEGIEEGGPATTTGDNATVGGSNNTATTTSKDPVIDSNTTIVINGSSNQGQTGKK